MTHTATILQARLLAFDKELWPLVDRTASLEARLNESEDRAHVVESDRKRLRLENSCLHIAIESLEQTVSQIIDREDECHQLHDRIQALEAQRQRDLDVHSEALQDKDRVHKGSLDALQGAIDKEKAQRELDRATANEQVKAAHGERDRCKRERDNVQGQRAELQKKLVSIETELKDLKEKFKQREQEHAEESLRMRHLLDEANLRNSSSTASATSSSSAISSRAGGGLRKKTGSVAQQIAKPISSKVVATAALSSKTIVTSNAASNPVLDSQSTEFDFS